MPDHHVELGRARLVCIVAGGAPERLQKDARENGAVRDDHADTVGVERLAEMVRLQRRFRVAASRTNKRFMELNGVEHAHDAPDPVPEVAIYRGKKRRLDRGKEDSAEGLGTQALGSGPQGCFKIWHHVSEGHASAHTR